LIVVYVFVRNERKVVLSKLAKLVVDNDDLIIAADNICFSGRLPVNWRNWIAGIALEKETFLDGFRDELLSLRLLFLVA
jgi:hypothetical protein